MQLREGGVEPRPVLQLLLVMVLDVRDKLDAPPCLLKPSCHVLLHSCTRFSTPQHEPAVATGRNCAVCVCVCVCVCVRERERERERESVRIHTGRVASTSATSGRDAARARKDLASTSAPIRYFVVVTRVTYASLSAALFPRAPATSGPCAFPPVRFASLAAPPSRALPAVLDTDGSGRNSAGACPTPTPAAAGGLGTVGSGAGGARAGGARGREAPRVGLQRGRVGDTLVSQARAEHVRNQACTHLAYCDGTSCGRMRSSSSPSRACESRRRIMPERPLDQYNIGANYSMQSDDGRGGRATCPHGEGSYVCMRLRFCKCLCV